MQDGRKAVWSFPYVSVAFFPSLKQNFMAYRSSKESSRPDCIFEIHELWQSGFIRVYSNCFCSCSFEPEIIKIGQSCHKMYSNNIVNLEESTTILNAHTKKVWKLIVCTSYIYIYIYIERERESRENSCQYDLMMMIVAYQPLWIILCCLYIYIYIYIYIWFVSELFIVNIIFKRALAIALIFVAMFITTFRPLYAPAFFRWLEYWTFYFAYRGRLF